MNNTIQLLTESILQVPVEKYQKDFTFIVNNKEYQTTRLVADLISPNISKTHQIDPTFSQYTIKTESSGDFQHFLDILDFKKKSIDESDLSFFAEIIDRLETKKIALKIVTPTITIDNVFDLLSKHQKQKIFYSKNISEETDFLSSHFYELKEEQMKEFLKIDEDILEIIISSRKLELESEDQLLHFLNELCSQNSEYSKLYECIYFRNVSNQAMIEFLSMFNIEYLTQSTWLSLSTKMVEKSENEIEFSDHIYHQKVEKPKWKEIFFANNNLKGIFSYLKDNSDDILNEVAGTRGLNGDVKKALDIESADNDLYPKGSSEDWLCFEFKNHKIIPTNYTINSYSGKQRLRSWVIECKEEGKDWESVDEQVDNASLKENKVVTFTIKNQNINKEKRYKYIRLRRTSPGWDNSDFIDISSIEFYGFLI